MPTPASPSSLQCRWRRLMQRTRSIVRVSLHTTDCCPGGPATQIARLTEERAASTEAAAQKSSATQEAHRAAPAATRKLMAAPSPSQPSSAPASSQLPTQVSEPPPAARPRTHARTHARTCLRLLTPTGEASNANRFSTRYSSTVQQGHRDLSTYALTRGVTAQWGQALRSQNSDAPTKQAAPEKQPEPEPSEPEAQSPPPRAATPPVTTPPPVQPTLTPQTHKLTNPPADSMGLPCLAPPLAQAYPASQPLPSQPACQPVCPVSV
jgi:hypothetical protein